MTPADRLAQAMDKAMHERGLLPVQPWNKKTLGWLEKLGCLVAYKRNRNGKTQFHPMKTLEGRGYDSGVQQYIALTNIFHYGGRPSGPRKKPFDWVHEGTIIRIKCAPSNRYKSRTTRLWMRETMLVWVPDDTANKILVLGYIP